MSAYATLEAAEASGTTYEQLDMLAKRLAREIDVCEDVRNLPQLSRQYRETVRARDEMQPPTDDEVSRLVEGFDAVR